MKISLDELKRRGPIAKLAIRSMDLSLYQAEAIIEGERHLVTDGAGKPLRSFNIVDMKEQLAGLDIAELVLVQESAYDEMIGQPGRDGSNALEVPLDPESQPQPPWLN